MAMPASPGWFVIAFTLGAAALFAVGLVIAAVAPTARAANAIGMLVFFPSLFLPGAWLPKHLVALAVVAVVAGVATAKLFRWE